MDVAPCGRAAPNPAPAPRAPDKSKRDEWSESGVMSLLEVYESKWVLRNRAKLKGSDWEEIARQVSDRWPGAKALKTPIQCKNKIESMKKRYRAESGECSSWQFYGRMDEMLKGVPNCAARPKLPVVDIDLQALPKMEPDVEVRAEGNLQCSNHDGGSNTLPIDVNANVDNGNGNDDNMEKKESRGTDSNESAPRSKVANHQDRTERSGSLSKRRKGSGSEVAESIRLLAHSILKIEQARMEMYKDLERMRVEAEIKRGEMDLKRTEIVAETQLQIAKLFAKRSSGTSNKGGNLSLPRREGMGN